MENLNLLATRNGEIVLRRYFGDGLIASLGGLAIKIDNFSLERHGMSPNTWTIIIGFTLRYIVEFISVRVLDYHQEEIKLIKAFGAARLKILI